MRLLKYIKKYDKRLNTRKVERGEGNKKNLAGSKRKLKGNTGNSIEKIATKFQVDFFC